jgi:hypothetical protein
MAHRAVETARNPGFDYRLLAERTVCSEGTNRMPDTFAGFFRHDALHSKVLGNSGTAKAVEYSLKRWPALARYVEDGRYPIDNNPIENAIRPVALGKKNWLFAGSETAGRRAAAIMSLLATAKANGREPHAWLSDVLERLPTTKDRDIEQLLPHRWETAPG